MEQIFWTRDFRRRGGAVAGEGGQNIKARLRYILVISYIDLYKPTYVCTHIRTHAHARAHTHTHIYTHTHTYAHTHRHTHTHIHTLLGQNTI